MKGLAKIACAGVATRAWSLVALLALGLGIGASGAWLFDTQRFFLAVPACLALGWLVVADPTRCTETRKSAGRR